VDTEAVFDSDGTTSTSKNDFDTIVEVESNAELKEFYPSYKIVQFNGYKAYRYSKNYEKTHGTQYQGGVETLTFIRDKEIWIISIGSRSKEHLEKNKENFDTLLSTFKFL
jgi:hypothetical protein